MESTPPSQDQPRPAEDSGVLPIPPGAGTSDTQLFREIRTLKGSRSEFPLPSGRSRAGFYLIAALVLALVVAIAFRLRVL